MSLIIHTIVPDGIVVCSDTRTTHKDGNGHTRYSDKAKKTFLFPNFVIVSHCGDSKITNTTTVESFLCNFREKVDNKTNFLEIPSRILNEYIKIGGNGDTIFKVSGYIDNEVACTYTIETLKQKITLSTAPYQYGATYGGMTNIAHSIMNSGINYVDLSLEEAIILTKTCLETNITIFDLHSEQSIGGKCETYVIDKKHNREGVLSIDGKIINDAEIKEGEQL